MLNILTSSPTLGEIGESKQGLATGCNDIFLREWHEVNVSNIGFKINSTEDSTLHGYKWFPYNKGGSRRKWYGNQSLIVNWENDGYEIKHFVDNKGKLRSRPQNTQCYFKPSISWGLISGPFFRFFPQGFIYDIQGMSYFPDTELLGVLSWMNSKVFRILGKSINPREQYQAGDLLKLPCSNSQFPTLANECVNFAKYDWDAHETSWDFQQNELIALSKQGLGNVTASIDDELVMSYHILELLLAEYKAKWMNLFKQLHANEEELNRQFIEIYGLQDELTPEVPLDEITILQEGEIKIEENKIKWNDDVLMKQFISYAMGIWMGRYRLDKPGLHIAHPSPTEEEIAPYTYNGATIEIDDDGIIPLMDENAPFPDNAEKRMKEFVEVVFGSANKAKNIDFLNATLGRNTNIAKYLKNDFWKDHLARYQKRPIYWLFQSSRKNPAFQVLVYMHRMDAYTCEKVRTKYLLVYIEHLKNRILYLQSQPTTAAVTREQTQHEAALKECLDYEARLHNIANQQIAFDLDDGVKLNYAKFGDVLAPI